MEVCLEETILNVRIDGHFCLEICMERRLWIHCHLVVETNVKATCMQDCKQKCPSVLDFTHSYDLL